MPLIKRAVKTVKNFNLPLSYVVNDVNVLRDCSNVFPNQGRLDTRYGFHRFNAVALSGPVLSLSYFKKTDGTKYIIAKVGSSIYAVDATGSHSLIKSGLSESTKHRGITLNNRHIIAVDTDGLFSFNGSTFSELGQAAPTAPTIAKAASGSLPDDTYSVKITYYASTIGFESNGSVASNSATTSGSDNTLNITSIPGTATNLLIDKVRIYLKKGSGSWLFYSEISLGTTSSTVTAITSSSQTPPEKNAPPIAGSGKYLTTYNASLVYSGNNINRNDVYFSEADLPDAFDNTATQTLLAIEGDGEVTGLATGFFNDTVLSPYVAIFKKTSTHIFSEINGEFSLVCISDKIGCVSDDTIEIRNGDIFYLSELGWRIISNGKFLKDEKGNVVTLGIGKIDDIFRSKGFQYEANKSNFENFHSVYYPILDQYITWVSEGSSTDLSKAYVFNFYNAGFTAYNLPKSAICSVKADDTDNNSIVLIGTSDGYLFSYSPLNDYFDEDVDANQVAIAASAELFFIDGEDFDASYNFREMIFKSVVNQTDITVTAYTNYNLTRAYGTTISASSGIGFILDVSYLDQGLLTDVLTQREARADINRVGGNILLKFSQSSISENIGLISAQINFSKNGNRN